MRTRIRLSRPVVISVLFLVAAAAASFSSMNFFERAVFHGDLTMQLGFGVLAASLCVAFLCPKSWITLIVCAATAVGVWFAAPPYVPLFFPILLQAVMYDSFRREGDGAAVTFFASLICSFASLFFWPYGKRYVEEQWGRPTPEKLKTEPFVYLVFLALLLGLFLWLAVRCAKERRRLLLGKMPKKEKKSSLAERKKNGAAALRGTLTFAVCCVNLLAQASFGIFFIHLEYAKCLFFSQLLFLLFLELRREPMLRLHTAAERLLNAALGQREEARNG